MGGVLGGLRAIFDIIGEGVLAVLVGREIASRTTKPAYGLRAVLGGFLLAFVAGILSLTWEAATGTVSRKEVWWTLVILPLEVAFVSYILHALAFSLEPPEKPKAPETPGE